MTRPTLATGDVFTDVLANASIRPQIDGLDSPGSIDFVQDTQLSPLTNQIKARFYGWYDRIKLTVGSGLQLNYTGANILLSNGTRVAIADGSITLPNAAASFVYVNTSGAIASALTMPLEGIPLGYAVTAAGAVTSLVDLREQVLEQVRPIALPIAASAFAPGDIKPTFTTAAQAGWLSCDGQSVNVADYAALFAAIAYTYGGSGATFNIPDLRGRFLLPASASHAIGSSGGAERVTLSVNEMPTHGHGLSDPGHNHGINDPGHSHVVFDQGHAHVINDPGHGHTLVAQRQAALNSNPDDGSGAELSSQGTGNFATTQKSDTGVTMRNTPTGILVQPAAVGVFANPAATGIAILPQGGNASHENMPPFITCRYLIKV